jgi:hypothetical protein
MPVNEIAITTIVVLAIRDCAGWLWRRSSSPGLRGRVEAADDVFEAARGVSKVGGRR